MNQVKLENLIKDLRVEKPELDPRIKGEVMAYVLANGFHRANYFALRYAIGFAMLLLFGAGGTVFAAQSAQPGQVLYPVKRVSETAYVNIQPTSAAKVNVHAALINRRLAEADKLVDQDNDNDDINVGLNSDLQMANDAADESDAWVDAQENAFSLAVEREQ